MNKSWQFLRRRIAPLVARESHQRWVILCAGAGICMYAFAVLGYIVATPDIGLRHAFSTSVQRVDPDRIRFLPGEPPVDLRGYEIRRLGGEEVETWPQLLRLILRLPHPSVRITEENELRNDQLFHVQLGAEELVRVDLFAPQTGSAVRVWCIVGVLPREAMPPFLLWLILKAGLFIVAAMVYWQKSHDPSARQFFWLSVVTAGAYLGGYHWARIATQPVLLLVFMICAVLVPAVSLHFYLVFPKPKQFVERQPRWTLAVIYGPPVVFLLLLIWDYFSLRWLFHGSTRPDEVAGALELLLEKIKYEIYTYFAMAALWYLASITCMVHSFLTAEDATQRNQVKWILFGGLASLVPIGYTLYLAFMAPDDFGGGAAAWPMFAASVCVTAAFTISITRYRLMELDQILTSGMVYFLFSSLAGVVYYAVVFLGTLVFSQWSPASLSQAFGVSTAALVLMLVLDWLRGRVKRALDHRFSREKNQLDRTLRRLSEAVDHLIDPRVLARRLLQSSAELLGASGGAVYLREGSPPTYVLTDSLGTLPGPDTLSPDAPIVIALRQSQSIEARSRHTGESEAARRELIDLRGEVAQAITHEGELLAILVLGARRTGAYSPADLNLLQALAQLAALAVENAQGHHTIETLNQDLQAKVEKISEQQRRILALQSQLTRLQTTRSWRRTDVSPKQSEPDPDPTVKAVGIVGSGPPIRELLHLVQKVSVSSSSVLIRGESGTGKGLLARAIHDNSGRSGKPFVKVHCAALSPGLLESELFGHVKGAFTGAHRDKVGRFELANGGTLFLDEIGDISLETQTKLLRVLQEKSFERVGSSEAIDVDVRVISATHQDLEALIRLGRFREDLFYRLNVIHISVPPLRDRKEDIPELAQFFLHTYSKRCGKVVHQIDDDALSVLKSFNWPGNIRQLENVIERAVVVAEDGLITPAELPPELIQAVEATEVQDESIDHEQDPLDLPIGVAGERAERNRQERERLIRALRSAGGNKAQAARALGLARSTFLSRLQKHGLA